MRRLWLIATAVLLGVTACGPEPTDDAGGGGSGSPGGSGGSGVGGSGGVGGGSGGVGGGTGGVGGGSGGVGGGSGGVGGGSGGVGGGSGGSGGGAFGCEEGCAKLAECFAATPELVSPTCVSDCELSVAGPDGAATLACLACMDVNACLEIYPEDGTDSACMDECGIGAPWECSSDADCIAFGGEICADPDGDGVMDCSCGCDVTLQCDPVSVADPADCGCDFDCGGPACGPGEELSAFDGGCHPTCAAVDECYPFAAYCANDSLCYSVDAFAQCVNVAGLSPIGASAPLIYDPGQDGIGAGAMLCTKEPATCINQGNVCQFSFQFYDPDGDVATSHAALYSKIKMVTAGGTAVSPYDVVAANGSVLAFKGCFDEAMLQITIGAVLDDDAGNRSNPLCFEGSAP